MNLHPLLNENAKKQMDELQEFKQNITEFLNYQAHKANSVKLIDDYIRK